MTIFCIFSHISAHKSIIQFWRNFYTIKISKFPWLVKIPKFQTLKVYKNTSKLVLSTLFWLLQIIFPFDFLRVRNKCWNSFKYMQINDYLTSDFQMTQLFSTFVQKSYHYFSYWGKYSVNVIWHPWICWNSNKKCVIHKSELSKLCWKFECYPSPNIHTQISLSNYLSLKYKILFLNMNCLISGVTN